MPFYGNSMNELSFMDLINIVSFVVGLQNLDLNISQNDLDNQTEQLDKKLRSNVDEIHRHLEKQDAKIDFIIRELTENDENQKSSG